MTTQTPPDDRQVLRTHLRQIRRQLSPGQQAFNSQEVARQLKNHDAFKSASRIAAYLASDGELNLAPTIELAWSLGKSCYVPVVSEKGQMEFRQFSADSPLQQNRYGILEPFDSAPQVPAQELDLTLLPLVGFCRSGARLGMGGGYYDRAFAFKAQNQELGPYLIGIAHSQQELASLEVESWDIPLQAIATESEIIDISPSR